MRSLWIVVSVFVAAAVAEDLTLEEKSTGAEVVEAVIDIIDQSCVFSDDRQMLRRIAKLETDDGNADNTFVVNDEDYYGGIWRVDESMLAKALTRVDLYVPILNAFGLDLSKLAYRSLVTPLYSALIARIWIDSTPETGYEIPWGEDEQAAYWVETYHHFTDTANAQDYLDVIGELDQACEIPKADLVFVLDGSGSIEAANFETMLEFVTEVIDAFDVSEDAVRVGVIKYSSSVKTEFYLGQITDKLNVKTEVQRIVYEEGGTYTAEALDHLRGMFTEYGRGNGVPQISIVVTDGQSADPDATKVAATKVHDDRITVFALGVTDGVDMDELQAIGTDPDCIHVHLLSSFSEISPFTSKIQSQACKASSELDPSNDYDGSVVTGKRVFFKLKLKVKKNGATIKLKMRSGAGRLFISFRARNPGRAVFKYQIRVDSSMVDGSKIHLKIPDDIDTSLGYVEAFVALLGDGFGEQNLYTIGMNDGGLSDGAPGLQPALLLMTMMGALAALLGM